MADNEANTNYGFSDIHRYLSGQMTAQEMHDIERAALQDPFLADAIEGYQNNNKELSEKHLNEITAAIQGDHQEAKIIAISKRKQYGWLAVASVLIVVVTSVFIFYQTNKNNKPANLASNDIKSSKNKDSFQSKNNKILAPQKDSETAVMQDATSEAKTNRKKDYTANVLKRKERKQKPIASASPLKKEDSMLIAAAPTASLSYRSKAMSAQSSLPATADTLHNDSMSKSEANGCTTRTFAASPKSLWTTDKGKPFLLSEVEVININKKTKKATDTASVKPEGGWLFFQNYLFSKLSKKDSSAVANYLNNIGNLELEFSVSETGLPYAVQVIHAPDSTTANNAVSAIEQGPKWISVDKKEKRLNIKF